MADYSIWLIEFARAPRFPLGVFLYGEVGDSVLPYSVTVLVSDERRILVDTGYRYEGNKRALADGNGNELWARSDELLARVGVDARDIDIVVLTHAHFDHAGNLAPFRNATFFLQRRELEKWIEALALPPELGWLKDGIDPEDIHELLRLAEQGRLRLVDEPVLEIAPGVKLHASHDTHTYGHQHVVVDSETSGRWVLPGDAIYVYENVEGLDGSGRYVPIGFATGSQEQCLRTMAGLMESVGHDTGRLLIGHEARMWERHPSAVYEDDLHVVEVCLREGDSSRIGAVASHARERAGL